MALTWLAIQLTGSGLVLGTVLMTAAIPRAVFMLVGGASSDRFSPRTLMLASNAIRGVVVGILATLVLSGRAELIRPRRLGAIVMAVAVVLGSGLALIGLAPSLPVALAIIGVMGVLIGFINVQAIAWLQSHIAEGMRGRVMSLVTLGIGGAGTGLAGNRGSAGRPRCRDAHLPRCRGDRDRRALAGVAWGVPTQMMWPEEHTP